MTTPNLDKIIERLKELLQDLDKPDVTFSAWQRTVVSILDRVDSSYSANIQGIVISYWHVQEGNRLIPKNDIDKCKLNAKYQLNHIIKNLELGIYNLPKDDSNTTSQVINVNQSQNVAISIEIENILKDHLPESELKEVKGIIQSAEPKASKIKKLLEALNKYGAADLAKIIIDILLKLPPA